MKITYVFPSKTRESKFFFCLDNIRRYSESNNYEVICVLDDDDVTMNTEAVRSAISEYPNVRFYYGQSASKIAACNRELDKISSDTSIVCLHSDDMIFLQRGFDNIIRDAFYAHRPNLDAIIHFPDGHQKKTMTYTVMGYNLFKQLGYLYWHEYSNVYADNDLTEMCKIMGKHTFVDKNILIHAHPIFKLSSWDDQYKRNEARENYNADGRIFNHRKSTNFGL